MQAHNLVAADGELYTLTRLQGSLAGTPSVAVYDTLDRTMISLVSNSLGGAVFDAICSNALDSFRRFAARPPKNLWEEQLIVGDDWTCLFQRWVVVPHRVLVVVCAPGPVSSDAIRSHGRDALRALGI